MGGCWGRSFPQRAHPAGKAGLAWHRGRGVCASRLFKSLTLRAPVFAGCWMEVNSPARLSSPNVPPQRRGVWEPTGVSSCKGGQRGTDPLGIRSSWRLCVRCRVKSSSSAAARQRGPGSGQLHSLLLCCCPFIPFFPKYWISLDLRLDEILIQQTQ